MKGRAIGDLRCPDEASAVTVRDDIAAWLSAQANVWLVDGPPRATLTLDGWRVLFDVRFSTRQDAEQMYQRIQTRWNAGPVSSLILPGSRVSLHDCSHDDGVGDCSRVDAQFVKAVK